jgi:serine/threonine-protein kinase
LDRLVGRGASAEVWLAWHPDRPGPVAIKRGGDLRAEAQVLARVRHRGVVTLLDVVDDRSGPALVLAHLGGGTLRQVLDERGTLTVGELVAVLEPVVDACSALAREGFVHGDLKPEHVCFTEAGAPVLVDLGSAGTRSGTPAYLDPRVAAGAAPTSSSEVFSLAVVAYEALTGRQPHRGDVAHVLAAAAVGAHRSLRSWPAVPPGVADVVERGLDPDPDARPADPATFAAALREQVAGHEVVLPGPSRQLPVPVRPAPGGAGTTLRFGPAPPPPVGPDPVRRAPWLRPAGALAVSVALLAAGVSLAVRARPTPSPSSPSTAATALRCAHVLPPPPPGAVRRGDVDGDGCVEVARWDGATLVVATDGGLAVFRIAAQGQQLVLGDWDGDGADSPALYDPASGVTRMVDRLPDAVGGHLGPSRVVVLAPGGRAVVSNDGSGPGHPDRVRVLGA